MEQDDFSCDLRNRIKDLQADFFAKDSEDFGPYPDIAADIRGSHKYRIATDAAQLARMVGDPLPEWTLDAEEVRRNERLASIERHRICFCETNNPMYAWLAYLAALSIPEALPEW